MKRAALCCLTVLLLLAPARAQAAGQTPMDLPAVLRYAFAHSPALKAAALGVDAEAEGLAGARAARLPRADLSATATRYEDPQPVDFSLISALTSHTAPETDRTLLGAGAGLRLPLYRGGQLVDEVKIAQTRRDIAGHRWRLTRQELAFNLTSAYYKILYLEQMRRAARAEVSGLSEHLRAVEAKLAAGALPRLDAVKTQARLQHAKAVEIDAGTSLESAVLLLEALMGWQEPLPPALAGAPRVAPPAPEPLASALARALVNRPDYLAARARVRMLELSRRKAEGQWMPSLTATGDYADRTGLDTDARDTWSAALVVSLPVFDGGLIRSQVRRARIETEQAREEAKALRLSIRREVADALHQMTNAAERLRVARKSVEAAREDVRIERLKFDTGAGTTADLLDAQTGLLQARTDYHQAVFDRRVAATLLDKATGTEPEREV